MAYEHVVWVEEILKNIDQAKDKFEKSSMILEARDYFNTLSTGDKADVFVYLLGRNKVDDA